MLARLALRPNRALWAGAVGLAAAILLPVTGTMILSGLAPTLDGAWVAYAEPGSGDGLRWETAQPAPDWVVARSSVDPARVAYIHGPPHVARGQSLAMPEALATGPRAGATLDGLAPTDVLVHPDDLGPATATLAGFALRPKVEGALVVPSRGSDAFESATTTALRQESLALVVLSAPAVVLLAAALARQEVRALSRTSATLMSLGGRRPAFVVLAARLTLAVGLGTAVAVVVAYALHRSGGVFDPPDDPEVLLALAIAVPVGLAWVTGLVGAALGLGRLGDLRVAGPGGEDDVAWFVPARVRPVLLGLRPLAMLGLAALLFMADVGFPVAAAQVPGSLAGGPGEWVFGAEEGLHVGTGVDGSAALVADLDPRVAAVVAETVTPTLLDGQATVLRGAPWEQLRSFHRLGPIEGGAQPPSGLEVVLGERLARRLHAEVGDIVVAQGGDRADLAHLVVIGTVSAPGLLSDEAFVGEPLGRRLADLPPGQANLLRVRPDTAGALAALRQVEPNLVVASLEVSPTRPAAGALATANVTVANLGSSPGQRSLTVRVADQPVGHIEAVVAGHARRSFFVPFVAPAGDWQIEVNPTTDGGSGPAAWSWVVPPATPVGTAAVLRLQADGAGVPDVAAALYASAAQASQDQAVLRAITDASGQVAFTAPGPGTWVVGTQAQGGVFAAFDVTNSSAGLVVDAVWTEPAVLRLREQNQLLAHVINRGTEGATRTLVAFAGETRFAEQDVTLAPGADTVVSFVLYLLEPVDVVGVGETSLRLGTVAPTQPVPTAPGPAGEPVASPQPLVSEPNTGESVQAEVADRALGDARAVLAGLSASAAVSTLAVVALVTQRTLAGRGHVLGLLRVLGSSTDQLRQRAAAEGAVLGGLAGLAALLPAKALFWAVGRWGPAVFAHGLPDPIGWLFALQATTAFAGVCALAAYWGAGRAQA